MGKLDDIRKMREAKYDRDSVRSAEVRKPDASARPKRDRNPVAHDGLGSKSPELRPQRETVGKDLGADDAAQLRGKSGFDRAAYQRDYMKNVYRPAQKAKREAEKAELERLRGIARGLPHH